LSERHAFLRHLAPLRKKRWVVYSKPPFGGPGQVLKYLARYTHRVAISNPRLVALENGEVTFHWKDYAHGGGRKTMRLKATEFLRRFLLHVLPLGFMRIRHYGFLANCVCQEKLTLCRALLEAATALTAVALAPSATTTVPVAAGPALTHVCPCCKVGRMVIVELLSPIRDQRSAPGEILTEVKLDTS